MYSKRIQIKKGLEQQGEGRLRPEKEENKIIVSEIESVS